MILHPPFLISSALAPALQLGDATLSLTDQWAGEENRDCVTFELVTQDFTYVDSSLRSGCGGFRSPVEAFESFLAFLEAAAESYDHDGENADLFPRHVVVWASTHKDAVEEARTELCDEYGNPRLNLIED